jgi:putative copper resistance protein D
MLEAAVIAARLLQYFGAAIVFGSPLFFVYALRGQAPRGSRGLVAGACVVLTMASLLAVAAQASLFAGSFARGVTGESIGAVVSYMPLGKAALVRAGAAALALVLVLRRAWIGATVPGAVAAASLAWLGHAAATEGPLATLHLVSDALHALAACAWIGALAGFVLLMRDRQTSREVLHAALLRFSALGPWLVALLVFTGFINGWVLVGPSHLGEILSTEYGRVLLAKLALFAAMLLLAAKNRFRHTAPVAVGAPLDALRSSLALETSAGLGVLALVAWLGTLAPPAA